MSAEQRVRQLEQQTLDEKLANFDGILGALWDATVAAEADWKHDSGGKNPELALVYGYSGFKKLQLTIDRTLLQISQLELKLNNQSQNQTRPEHVIKLYDTILQASAF